MGEDEMRQIARWIDQAITHAGDEDALARINGEVGEMCRRFPAPGIAVD
jgi:glycine/serine hydroxymethyltransferase